MRVYILLFLALITFNSCSSGSDDSPNNENQVEESLMNVDTSYQGGFVSVAHTTRGLATINKEKTVLKVTNFKTDNGPILELYLATDTTAETYVSLGVLKGLNGDYEYNLPEDVDFDVYKYVTVWCVDFKIDS